jgi:hypothetical protein
VNSRIDVAIVGAGPYGLSLASHLRARGVEFRIFGSPMETWRNMPKGIALKSFDFATNIYAPVPNYSFVEYCRARGIDSRQPVAMTTFTGYGLWAQGELVPEVEAVLVRTLARTGNGFVVELSTGERVLANRIVVAVGLGYFERLPDVIADLPRDVASHTSWHADYVEFAGREVTVIGAGQSAIEAAALLHEAGASVQMIVRGEGIWFAEEMADRRSLRARFMNPQSVVGPGRVNWVLEHFPTLIHYAPEHRRVRFTRRHLGPFGTWWLRDRVVGQFPIHFRTAIVGARQVDRRAALRICGPNGESELLTDHVVAGTGYEVDLGRLPFLVGELLEAIDRVELAPRLNRHFESSVPGMFFVGPAAALSFGPLMRFVCGAAFAAPTVAKRLRRTRPARRLIRKPSALLAGDR